MRTLFKSLFFVLSVSLFVRCAHSGDPSATSSLSLKMSAATPGGLTNINAQTISTAGARSAADTLPPPQGVSITDVMVNVRNIKFDFDHDDEHFKKDSSYSEDDDARLKGPFLVDLMNAGAFVDQVVTTVNLPNARYERVRFKLSPSREPGDMLEKSILITGKIDTIPFTFWHWRDSNFGARFKNTASSDSIPVSTTGAALDLAIRLELDKVFNVLEGGVDLSKAVDGNKDGIITIDPKGDDGNTWLADRIMMLLERHAYCERRDH